MVGQAAILVVIAATLALAILSGERGLTSLAQSRPPAPPPTGFSAVLPTSADPALCPGGGARGYPTAVDGLADDCAALLSALPALGPPDGFDWSADAPINDWSGVILGRSPARVVALDLTTAGLTGSVPPELAELVELQALHLYGNDLTGHIPPELGRLANLTILDLGANRLTGTIPPELGRLENLLWIDLSSNELTGSIPAEFEGLHKLEWLVIADNDLTGSVTDLLESLPNLAYISLYDTQLTGCVPDALRDVDGFPGDIAPCAGK